MIPVTMSIYDGIEAITFSFGKKWKIDLRKAFKHVMRRKYDGYKVYVHNFSYFDSIFTLDILSNLGSVKPIMRQNKILKLIFKYSSAVASDKKKRVSDKKKGVSDKKKRVCRLYFYDSFLLLPDSLDSLSKSFNIEKKKSKFPLKFLNKPDFSINYVGAVPEYNYFYKSYTKDFTLEDYKDYFDSFPHNEWNLKRELEKYCEIDTIALYQVITKFQFEIYKLFDVDITKYPTASSLAFGIYKTNYNNNTQIPIILSKLHYTLKLSMVV